MRPAIHSRIILLGLIVSLIVVSCKEKTEQTNMEINLKQDWKIFSSRDLQHDGKIISSPGFRTEKAYTADLPATVMATLVRNDVYPDVFFSDNLSRISPEQFTVPWWYRKTFQINSKKDAGFYTLVFEGINYKANIWLNGHLIAASDSTEGCFRMFEFDVTNNLLKGENVLAVEIIPPEWGDLTIGFVDWNPWPPDNNMGLWRPVKLIKTRPVSLKNVFVKPSLDTPGLKEASLTISADLVNHSADHLSGSVEVETEEIRISQEYSLDPHQTKSIVFDPPGFPELNITEPRIWWPANLGEPNLYRMNITATTAEGESDRETVRFGIRDVDHYFTDEGHRGFMINGKKILIKGAGWVDDLFLDDPDEKVEDQIRYVKHMNLNTIRLEGFWGKNKKIYDLADEYGILVMIGWSCQWEWEGYCGRPEDDYLAIRTPEEIEEHARAYRDQVVWLRNHPSVFLWVYGSDKLLVPELETQLNKMLAAEDGTRPVLNSCGSRISEITGSSGVKMNGPYAYVTPNYWYEDDSRGGAFGFNTETGPGAQPSPVESIRRMIPHDHLWPVDSIWEYHLGRNQFRTFKYWMKPFIARYGRSDGVETFAYKSQMANYEAIRPMFEAFKANRPHSTGVIQWMLNSAWPGMLWQLYDWYLMPNGAFYGTKNACSPLNIMYNYRDRDIYISNEYLTPFENLTAEIRVLDRSGKKVFEKILEVGIGANTSRKIFDMPELKDLTTTYFMDLRLKDGDSNMIGTNFYWLSTEKDELDFDNSEWFVTPNTSYADLTGINEMQEVQPDVDHEFSTLGDTLMVRAMLENNTEQVAFFIELKLSGKESGMPVLPVFWEDNYISLLPGEKREITGYVFSKDLGKDKAVFSYKGWNLK